MHVLNDSCVAKIHAKGIAKPAKLLADVVRALACFVQNDPCPSLEQVSRILVQVLGTYPRAHFLDCLLNKRSHSISHHDTMGVFCVW
jgi:hypothetical protein